MSQLYSTLTSGSIRLLELLDDTGPTCNLAPFELKDAPPFIALSYTWGRATYQKGRPPDLDYAITLNGEKTLVQQNLYDAITTLAQDVRGWRRRSHWLWVDFICINQSDVEERSNQVKLMKEIYEKSAAVFGWLGVPYNERETELAIKLMRSFNEYLRAGLEAHDDDIDTVLAGIDTLTPGFPSAKESDEWEGWMGIAEMMNNRYWSRTWIYQEATTPGSIWFYCGRACFNDIHLSAASSFGTRFARYPDFDHHFSTAVGFPSNMTRLSLARIEREQGRSRSLLSLVTELRNTSCTDARDKIYAALGHATDIKPGRILVDYNKDVKTVFGDFVRYEMTTNICVGLHVLNHVHTPASDATDKYLSEVIEPSWPSWIPDWRQKVTLPALCAHGPDQPCLFDPYPECPAKVEFSDDMMSIRGSTLSDVSITHLTRICEDDRDVVGQTQKWAAEMATTDPSAASDDSVRRSLVANISSANYDAEGKKSYTKGFMLDWHTIHTDDAVFARVSNVCLGRRMGRTSHGGIGIFPAAAQVGDMVSIFYGGTMLYLLRPIPGHENHFRFIGACYVDRLMDGEAVKHGICTRTLHLV